MTLLELLRQELPKRGGWPKGANYIVQDGDDGMIKTSKNLPTELNPRGVWKTPPQGWGNCGGDIRGIATLADDRATAIVTREQYEATGWDGTGLPPVGVECEYSLNSGRTWFKCKIDYILGTQGLIMLADVFEGGQWVSFHEYDGKLKFRPLRSERDKVIAEMRKVVTNYNKTDVIHAIEELYDAGYRKLSD